MLDGQVTVTVVGAMVMAHAPLTGVIVKFDVLPLITGATDPEPIAGPTEAGLSVQFSRETARHGASWNRGGQSVINAVVAAGRHRYRAGPMVNVDVPLLPA